MNFTLALLAAETAAKNSGWGTVWNIIGGVLLLIVVIAVAATIDGGGGGGGPNSNQRGHE